MYFMTSARGQGLAKKLALLALDYAREQGFKRCYLRNHRLPDGGDRKLI